MSVLIAPSILSADFARLGDEIRAVEAAGCDLIHVDVMDGHFVPNITIGPLVVEAARKVTRLPLDVHLMIENPLAYAADFVRAGADIVTIHVEADCHLFRTLDVIKSNGAKAGVSLNPATPLAALDHVIGDIDMILIMTVNPGFGGQGYIPAMDEKIAAARRLIEQSGRSVDLEVDGGIKAGNAGHVVHLGANVLVMGSEIFGAPDYTAKIREVRESIMRETGNL
jgi:ribulose-phosphate 3-epimerase